MSVNTVDEVETMKVLRKYLANGAVANTSGKFSGCQPVCGNHVGGDITDSGPVLKAVRNIHVKGKIMMTVPIKRAVSPSMSNDLSTTLFLVFCRIRFTSVICKFLRHAFLYQRDTQYQEEHDHRSGCSIIHLVSHIEHVVNVERDSHGTISRASVSVE